MLQPNSRRPRQSKVSSPNRVTCQARPTTSAKMVKGNKFKTAEFLEKQASKAKTERLPAAAVPESESKPTNTVHSSAQTLKPAAKLGQQKHAPRKLVQHDLIKSGTKRKAPSAALTEVSNVSPALSKAAAPAHKQAKKRKKQRQQSTQDPLQATAAQAAPAVKKQRLKKQAAAVPTILTAPAPLGKAMNSNWAALKSLVTSAAPRRQAAKGKPAADRPPVLKAPEQVGSRAGVTPVVAIDCEMVGVGPNGARSALAR